MAVLESVPVSLPRNILQVGLRYVLVVSITRLFLQVALCISLIANTAVAAQACARMKFEQPGVVEEASAPATVTLPPCHPQDGPDPLRYSSDREGQGAASLMGDECCQEEVCRWACAQQPATDAGFVGWAPLGVLPVAFADTARHRTPFLPHLIRPPIG